MAIVDQYGRPFQGKALQEPQTGAARLAHVHKQIQGHPARGLTPARLNAILQDAEGGDITAQHELFADMEERDAHLFAELSKRRRSVAKLEWDIVPPRNASKQEQDVTAYAKEAIGDMPDLEDLLFDALDGVAHGFAALELQWQRLGSDWAVVKAEHRPQSWLMLERDTRTQLRLRNPSGDGEALQPFGWVLHVHRARSGYLTRGGLGRVLVWPYVFKHYGAADLAEFLDIYGLPLLVGKYPNNASDEEKATLWRAVSGLGHNARGIMPSSMALEALEAAAGREQPFTAMIDWCERSQSKAIVGSTLTSSGGATGLGSGLANVHNEVRLDIRDSDAKQLAGTLTRDLVYPLLAVNKGWADMRRTPRFVFNTVQAEDMAAYADALPKLVAIGVQVPKTYANDKLRIPVPKDGEAVLGMVGAPSPPVPKQQSAAPAALAALNAASAALAALRAGGDRSVPLDGGLELRGPQPDVTGLKAVDDYAKTLEAQALDDQMQGLLSPLLQALHSANDLEGAQAALDAAGEHLDIGALAQALARAGFAAHWLGRGDA